MVSSDSFGESLFPEGESLRKAILWLSSRLAEGSVVPRWKLIDEASLRFDLSPVEEEFLRTQWTEEHSPDSGMEAGGGAWRT